jgi:predicted component of type VI protein secretion system
MSHLQYGEQLRSIGPGVLSIGSGVEAVWRVRETDVLRLHALVVQDGQGGATLSRASADATIFVNGDPLGGDTHRLRAGDWFQLGAHIFTFVGESVTADDSSALAYLRDARRDRVHVMRDDVITIGRDPASTVVVQEPEVARTHARLERDGGVLRLHPMSGAHVLLNGGRVDKPTALADGDAIGMGRTVLWFSVQPPGRRALEMANAMRTDRYTRRVPTSKMGVVERREEREERTRRRWQTGITAMAVGTLVLIIGLLAWRHGLVSQLLALLD